MKRKIINILVNIFYIALMHFAFVKCVDSKRSDNPVSDTTLFTIPKVVADTVKVYKFDTLSAQYITVLNDSTEVICCDQRTDTLRAKRIFFPMRIRGAMFWYETVNLFGDKSITTCAIGNYKYGDTISTNGDNNVVIIKSKPHRLK